VCVFIPGHGGVHLTSYCCRGVAMYRNVSPTTFLTRTRTRPAPQICPNFRYVELLDKYFGSVCELDIIFNYEKAYFMLDELLLVRLLSCHMSPSVPCEK
jgi:hypothetical protein